MALINGINRSVCGKTFPRKKDTSKAFVSLFS